MGQLVVGNQDGVWQTAGPHTTASQAADSEAAIDGSAILFLGDHQVAYQSVALQCSLW